MFAHQRERERERESFPLTPVLPLLLLSVSGPLILSVSGSYLGQLSVIMAGFNVIEGLDESDKSSVYVWGQRACLYMPGKKKYFHIFPDFLNPCDFLDARHVLNGNSKQTRKTYICQEEYILNVSGEKLSALSVCTVGERYWHKGQSWSTTLANIPHRAFFQNAITL